jgi:DNA-binding CsgD family transcriptional regulator
VLDVTQSKLVGRVAELGRLQSLLAAAAAGQPVVALVGGDAGVGKTRLVTELTAQARERGFTVLVGRCAELADTVPYLPLADALRDATSGPSVAGPVLEALAARPVLSRLLPDAGAAGPVGADLPGLAQQQLFGAVLGMLAELAEASPVLLVLEDLHWADRSTRDLVTFLSRVMHRERLALVVTYRTDDMHRRHPLRPVIAELLRLPGVTSVGLGPLPATAMAEHLTSIASEPLDAAELGNLISRAEGNAYYAEELLASGVAHGGIVHGGAGPGGVARGAGNGGTAAGWPGSGGAARDRAVTGRPEHGGAAGSWATDGGAAGSGTARTGSGTVAGELPAGLADLLLARMERLSPTAQQVLRAAAVTGRRVDDELVRQASGLDELEYEEAVREAVAHQLLMPDGGGGGYSFRHALLREAIYADLLPGERTRLHASLAALLRDEQRLAEVRGSAAELAHHSLASHDIPGAFTASILAAQEAHQLAAPAEAHRHYDQALSLWERVSDPERLAGMDRGKLAFRSAVNAADSGDALRAVQQLRRLLTFLTPESDPVLYSRASERLAYFLLDIDDDEDAIEAANAAVNALPADPPSWERARALATHARTLLHLTDTAPAQARAEQAAAAAEAADAPWVHADALVTLGLLSEQTGNHAEAIRRMTAADQEAGRTGVLGVQIRAAFQLARTQLEWGDLDAASAVAHAGLRVATDAGLGLAPYGLDLQYLHYLAHYADGDWNHAQQLADGFPVRVTSIAEARLSAMALFIDISRGNSSVAVRRAWLEPFFTRDRFAEFIGRGLLAEYALWQGDGDTALAEAEATIKAIEAWDQGFGPPVIRATAIGLAALADRARQARAAGEHQRAAAAAQAATSLIEIARQGALGTRGVKAALGSEGRGWLARAEAEWRRASGENAPEQWQAVVDEFEPHFVYESARSRWRLAEALVEAGRRDEAEREYQTAVAAAERLGAAPLQAALADLARRARLTRHSGPDGTRPAGPGGSRPADQPGGQRRGPLTGLTSRELEVLRLLAAGQSNKEIGAELFIATKTASVHVSNILAKLGAASRTEAAAIAHSEGLGRSAPQRDQAAGSG